MDIQMDEVIMANSEGGGIQDKESIVAGERQDVSKAPRTAES